MTDDIIARIDARCAESAAFSRGAAEMKRRAIAACEACVSDVTGTVSDADEAAQLAVAACVAAVRVTPWPTMTVNDAPALAWGPLPSAAEIEAHVTRSAPARASDGAPWARKHSDSSGAVVSIVYLSARCGAVAALTGGVMIRQPRSGVWYPLDHHDRAAQWRPVDGDGMPAERGER